MSQYQPVSDLKVKTREYKDKETGKMKGVWLTVGTLWSTEHGSSKFITLDSIPVSTFKDGEKVPFDGRISIFNREDKQEFAKKEYAETDNFNKKQTYDVVLEGIDDKPIDLSKIPF